MVLFFTKDWDALMFNTKFISDSLPIYSSRKIYIEIADKKNGLCNKGIGFGCSIFEYTAPYNRRVFNVDQENRLCVAILSKTKTGITLELLSKVNWNSLQ